MRGLLMIGGAVLLGLLLFLLVTARQRGESPAVAPTCTCTRTVPVSRRCTARCG